MSRDRGVCIGVDTSCYTTSLAAVDAQSGALLSQRRNILPVPMGQCGLRQSDALYQHVLQLPDLFRQLFVGFEGICAVSCRLRQRFQNAARRRGFLYARLSGGCGVRKCNGR